MGCYKIKIAIFHELDDGRKFEHYNGYGNFDYYEAWEEAEAYAELCGDSVCRETGADGVMVCAVDSEGWQTHAYEHVMGRRNNNHYTSDELGRYSDLF